jgi:ABC-type protease/lipase transport system fused ATPase/permease subunit
LLKKLGKTVIVVTHRNNLLSLADKVLLLVDGQIGGFGPRDEILAGLAKSQQLPKA